MSTTADLVTLRKAGGFARVYEPNKVPATPTHPYVVLGYTPAPPGVRSQLGDGSPVRRFFVQHFAKTMDGLEDVSAATFAMFDGKAISGDVCTQEIATPVDRDPDDSGVLSTTHTYRY